MSARSRVAEAAQKAGFENKATESEQSYWGVDEWRKGRRYVRIYCDVMGRVRSATWGSGSKSASFGGTNLAEQVLAKIDGWVEGQK